MHEYIFILGRAGELCLAEAKAVLEQYNLDFKIIFSSSEILRFTVSNELPAENLIKTLGGTIKIAKIAAIISREDIGKIAAEAGELLLKRTTGGRILFGVSVYNSRKLSSVQIAETIKENLKKRNISSRYITNGKKPLTSVQVNKHGLEEIVLFTEKGNIIAGRTLAVQDFGNWGKRDYGRPQVYPHEGMLPPKIARMMINLATSNFQFPISNFSRRSGTPHLRWQSIPNDSILKQKITVLDPFCGCGTILAEAMILGCDVIGGDVNQKSVNATEKNLAWLRETYGLTSGYKIFQTDAVHISEKILKVDIIATEPFLGPNLEGERRLSPSLTRCFPRKQIRNIMRGLEKLYIGCFSDWRRVLNKGGAVAFVFPVFESDRPVKKVLDKIMKLGYTVTAGPFEYGRPNARVRRRIYLFNF